MRIERVKLTNFGPHESLDVDTASGVFFVVGSNGSGKSNFLQAIKFAFTKDLDGRRKETFIRNYGQENGAKKAVDEVWWVKNGKRGHITRTITPSGIKSVLEWDGEKYTKEADIAERMSEIMGVDKAALSNAVFTKQGELANLITGTPGERQTIFFRLLNLGFLDPRAADLAKKIEALKEGCVDYGPALDEVRGTISELESQIADLQAGINSIDDPAAKIKYLDERCYDLRELGQTDSLIDMWNGNKVQSEARINAILGLAKCKDPEEINKHISDERELINRRAADLKRCEEDIAAHAAWDKWTQVRTADMARLKQTQEKLAEYAELGTSEVYDKVVSELKVKVEKATMLKGITQHVESTRLEVDAAEKELEECRQRKDSSETKATVTLLDACKKQLEVNTELLRTTEHSASLYNDDGTPKYDGGVCPTCGQAIAPISQEKAASLKETVRTTKECITKFETLITTKTNELNNLVELPLRNADSRLSTARRMHDAAVQQYELLAAGAPLESAELLSCTLRDTERERDEVRLLETQQRTLEMRIAEAEGNLARFNGEEPANPDIEEICEEAGHLEKRKQALSEWEEWATSIAQHQGSIDSAARAVARQMERRKTQAEALQNELGNAPSGLEGIDLWSQIEMSGKIQELREIDTRLCSLRDQMAATQHAISIKRKREQELVELIGKNAVKIDLIRELNEARQLILKTGVPTLYMEDIFRKMTATVNQLLDQMQANFKVSPDPESPLTFQFVRLDNPTGYELPQEVLSGGQSIRLALALLIAVQRLIVPDVGLLVLDEPSSHIDAEGVESMAAMFRNLGKVWSNTETQLIVVDHNPSLISACDKSISLGDVK